MVTEIRRAESDRNSNNAAIFYGYPYLTFYLEEIFCAYIINNTFGHGTSF